MSAPISRRLSLREATDALGFPNMGELLKYRVRCKREGIAFPEMSHGSFAEAEIMAWKKSKEVAAQQIIPPPSASAPSLHDRRSGVADRRRRA